MGEISSRTTSYRRVSIQLASPGDITARLGNRTGRPFALDTGQGGRGPRIGWCR
jgi:hypothetical protein